MNRRRVTLTALVTAAVLIPSGGWATATPLPVVRRADDDPGEQKKRVDASLATTRANLQITTTALATAQAKLDGTKARIATASTALATATSNLTAAETAYTNAKLASEKADKEAADAQIRLTAAETAVTKAQAMVTSTATSTSTARTRVGSIARRAYKSGGFTPSATPALTALASGGSNEALTGASTLLKLNNRAIEQLRAKHAEQVATADRLAGVKRQVADAKKAADGAAARAKVARTNAETARTKAASEKTAKENAKKALDALQVQQAADVQALNSKKAGEISAIATMQTESDRLTAVLKARAEAQRRAIAEAKARAEAQARAEARAAAQAKALADAKAAAEARARAAASASATSSAAPTTSTTEPAPATPTETTTEPVPTPAIPAPGGVLDMPASAGAISSGFGYRMHPVLNMWLMHGGQDFAVGCGSPVYAARDGDIVAAGVDDSYGNRVIIDHGLIDGSGVATLYAHLQSIAVSSGHVSRGQLIGYSGTTGRSTGCHLHFEVRQDGVQVDPMGFF